MKSKKKISKFQKVFNRVCNSLHKRDLWHVLELVESQKEYYRYFYNLGLQSGRREKK